MNNLFESSDEVNRTKYRITLMGIIILVIIASIFAVYYFNTNKSNEKEPYQIIDVYIYNLPSLDQQELKSGIMVQDDDKLRMIIEDYES